MTAKHNHEPENILVRLKRETAEIHQDLESRMPFGDEDFSPADYKRLLAGFYEIYGNFEPSIERAARRFSIAFDYSRRLKTPKIEIDLQNLKVPFAPVAANEPALDSAEELFGALYVIEGSTLGGQVISRILKQKFDLDESNGAAFFNGYGADTGAMWNEFRAAITEFAGTNDNHGAIVAAAIETFERFGRAVVNR